MNPVYCCNFCAHIPDLGVSRPYFLSSCGHILCEICCRQEGGSTNCPVCQSGCRFADISNDPRPEIKAYFTDPLDTLRQSVTQVVKVAQFQNAQAQRYKTQMRKRMDALQAERDSILNENTSLKRKVDNLEQLEQNWIGSGCSQNADRNDFLVPPQPQPPPPERSPFFVAANTERQNGSNTLRDAWQQQGTMANGVQRTSTFCTARITQRHTPTLPQIQLQRRSTPLHNLNMSSRILHRPVNSPSTISSISRSSSYMTPVGGRPSSSMLGSRTTNPPSTSSGHSFRTTDLLNRLSRFSCASSTDRKR